MSQTRLENEVDKLLDRVFTVNMLLHPDKMDEVQSTSIEIDRSAEYKADQFLEWSDRCRTLIMMYSLGRAKEMKMGGGGSEAAKQRSDLRAQESDIKGKLDEMKKWLKKQSKGRKKSKYTSEALTERNLTYKVLSKKFAKLSSPSDDVDAPKASVSDFLSSPGGALGGGHAGDDFDQSLSEEEEEMTAEHLKALEIAKEEEAKQDELLRKIEEELHKMTSAAENIGTALEDQEAMMKKAHAKVQETNARMVNINEKLAETNEDAEKDHPELICVCICCVGILLGLAIVAYKLIVAYLEQRNSDSSSNRLLL